MFLRQKVHPGLRRGWKLDWVPPDNLSCLAGVVHVCVVVFH